MDPRYPNVAFAANTCALVLGIGLLFSLFLPVGTPTGWAIIETILAVLIVGSWGLSYWAKRENEIPVVHAHGTSMDQYEAMEDLPTMVNLDNNQELVNPNTAAVIASIIGTESTQEDAAVSNAINTLTSGEIGASSAAAVVHNEIDHTKVNVDNIESRGFETQGIGTIPLPSVVVHNDVDHAKENVDNFESSGFQSQGIGSIPLPSAAVVHNDVEDIKVSEENFDSRGFQTQGIASIPLPEVPALELPELPAMADLPEMLDLEDLLNEDAVAAAPAPLDLPELPDF